MSVRVLRTLNAVKASSFNSIGRCFSMSVQKFASGSGEVLPKFEGLLVTKPVPNVFHVSLNRPSSKNALNVKLWGEIREVFEYLSSCSECRVVVLSGSNNTFCSGLDLREALPRLLQVVENDSLDVGRKALNLRNFIAHCQNGISSIEKCEKPVIAAICGHCIGAGTSLATAADIRFTTKDAVFSIKEIDLAITADVGVLNRINKLIGNDSIARELTYTGRNFTGQEAFNYGLVSRLVSSEECVEQAVTLAKEIAEKSPVAIRGAKLLMNYARDHTVQDSLEYVRLWNQAFLQSEDLIQAGTAILSKTKSSFRDA